MQPANIVNRERDEIAVVKYRLFRVSLLCISLTVLIPQVLSILDTKSGYLHFLRSFGVIPGFTLSHSIGSDLLNSIHSVTLICVLFAGPIADYIYNLIARYGPKIVLEDIEANFGTIHGFRDQVFAPITEELIFRAMVVNILQSDVTARHSANWITYISPLFFGISHIHHARQLYRKNISGSVVIFNTLFQTAYTTLFGILANKVYLASSNNLLSPILLHSVCNLMGFPALKVEGPKWFLGLYYILLVGGTIGFFAMCNTALK